MVLVTHQMQGSYVTLPSQRLPWIRGIKLKRSITTCHVPGTSDRSLLSKRNVAISVGTCCACRPKPKAFHISAFKGTAQYDESGKRGNCSKSAKNCVKLKESQDPIKESSNANKISVSYPAEANKSTASSTAIHRLFKKWLTNLSTPSSGEMMDGILAEETSDTPVTSVVKERNAVLKTAFSRFLALDATVKIPLLVFIPFYVAMNVAYGAEVSKELTPLWILGPVILGFYVKMVKWLFWLYAFTFRMTVKVVKDSPTYAKEAYMYVMQGKLHAHLVQPFVHIRNVDCADLSTRVLKGLQLWAFDIYLDFVESIWPYYNRAIRFLKKANLI